jgi:hypothetical protein
LFIGLLAVFAVSGCADTVVHHPEPWGRDAVRGAPVALTSPAAEKQCAPPQGTAGGEKPSALEIPTVGKLMMDMMVMALACDMTSVGTLQ